MLRKETFVGVLAPVVLLMSFALGGCGRTGGDGDRNSTGGTRPTPNAATPADPAASSSAASGSDSLTAPVPEACKMLTDVEVKTLTGRAVGQMVDTSLPNEPAQSGCLWNLEIGGAVYLILYRRTPEQFTTESQGFTAVPGVGYDAFTDSIHLVVRVSTVVLDIIVRTGEADAAHLERMKETAKVIIPRVR